jgi:hypothetical protein
MKIVTASLLTVSGTRRLRDSNDLTNAAPVTKEPRGPAGS